LIIFNRQRGTQWQYAQKTLKQNKALTTTFKLFPRMILSWMNQIIFTDHYCRVVKSDDFGQTKSELWHSGTRQAEEPTLKSSPAIIMMSQSTHYNWQ
jgi:hypothetical protein